LEECGTSKHQSVNQARDQNEVDSKHNSGTLKMWYYMKAEGNVEDSLSVPIGSVGTRVN
jgi:hypothetical protein